MTQLRAAPTHPLPDTHKHLSKDLNLCSDAEIECLIRLSFDFIESQSICAQYAESGHWLLKCHGLAGHSSSLRNVSANYFYVNCYWAPLLLLTVYCHLQSSMRMRNNKKPKCVFVTFSSFLILHSTNWLWSQPLIINHIFAANILQFVWIGTHRIYIVVTSKIIKSKFLCACMCCMSRNTLALPKLFN